MKKNTNALEVADERSSDAEVFTLKDNKVILTEIFQDNVREKNKYSEQIERLQEKIAYLEDKGKESKFYSILIIVLLADVICFRGLGTLAIIFIFLLELIGLIVAAKNLGQEGAVRFFIELEQMISSWLHHHKSDNDKI